MATITSDVSYNNIKTHVVGYENNRFRYETAKFVVPDTYADKPVVSAYISTIDLGIAYSSCNPGASSASSSPATYYSISSYQNTSTANGEIGYSNSKSHIILEPYISLKPGTYYLTIFTTSKKYGWRYFPNTSAGFEATLYVEYTQTTKCEQPSWVDISGYVTPQGPITATWGAGGEGTNNKISGYYVVIKNENGDILGKKTVDGDITLCEVFPDSSWGSGGTGLHCEVKTRGKAGEDYDSSYTTGGSIIVNNVPSIDPIAVSLPSSASGKTIPSSGGTAIFTLSANDGDGDSLIYQYSRNNSNWTNCSSTFSCTIEKNETQTPKTEDFFFRVYDNRQYSNVETCTITVNNRKKASITVSFSNGEVSCEQKNYSKYKVKILSYDGEAIFDSWEQEQREETFQFLDLRYYASMKNDTTMKYTIQMQYFDGIEWSDWSDSREQSYTSPTFSSESDTDRRVYSKATLNCNEAQGYKYFATEENPEKWAECVDGKITMFTENLPWGEALKIIYAKITEDSRPIKIDIGDLKLQKVYEIPVKPIGDEKIYLFDNTKPNIIKLYLPSSVHYGIGIEIGKPPYLYLLYGEKEVGIKPVYDSNTGYASYEINKKELCSAFGIDLENQPKITSLTLKIKNLKGDPFCAEWPVSVNYSVDAQLIQYVLDSSWPTATGSGMIQGATLKLKAVVATTAATKKDAPKFGLSFPFGTFPGYIETFSKSTTTSFENWEEGAHFSIEPNYYDVSISFTINQEIRQDYTSNEKIIDLYMDGNLVRENLRSFDIWKHYPGKIFLKSQEYTDGFLKISWHIEDWGINEDNINNAEILFKLKDGTYLCDKNGTQVTFSLEKTESGWPTMGEQKCDFGYYDPETGKFESRDILQLAPILRTRIESNSKETKEYNYTLIYNQLPTIAYRKNHVGFNTNNPDSYRTIETEESDVAMVVCEYQGRNKVIFTSTSADSPKKICFNLAEGSVIGLTIDCGSW